MRGDDDGLEDPDDDSAEAKWRKATAKRLRDEAVARWTASRAAVDRELDELGHQADALRRIRDAFAADDGQRGDDAVAADILSAAAAASDRTRALLAAWDAERDSGKWCAAFSRPRLKLPDIRDYLAANRSKAAEDWLKLQRVAHSEASRVDRATGVMGSCYGQSWPFSGVPTATQMQGDHVVPVEHMTVALLLLETRDPRQNPLNIALCLDEENQSKSDSPLGLFSPPSEAKAKGVYSPSMVSVAKKQMLARKVAAMSLLYPCLSHRKASKGVASLQRSSGVDLYGRAWDLGPFKQLVATAGTDFERRIELLSLGIVGWQVHNPLVFQPTLLTDELKTLLGERFKGTNPLLKVLDEALGNSVLFAPR